MHWAITGATGFLGIHILGELLRGDDTFTLLSRPPSDPIARIGKALPLAVTDGQVWTEEELRDRFTVVAVDLAAPKLGLSDERFRELADSADAILHCAGSIEQEADLADLRRTNVGGTTRILELAEAGSRAPDLFHVSTAFVTGKRRSGLISSRSWRTTKASRTTTSSPNSRPSRWCGIGRSAPGAASWCCGRAP